jgi:hypothetical protein
MGSVFQSTVAPYVAQRGMDSSEIALFPRRERKFKLSISKFTRPYVDHYRAEPQSHPYCGTLNAVVPIAEPIHTGATQPA